ncbi:hypothetical protein [Burkholderia sp. BCC0405]|nr:hypothetical protein [Burkholderia sp. BCC0405]
MQSTIEQTAWLGGAIRAVRQVQKHWRTYEASGRVGAWPSRAVGKETAHG